MRHILLMLGIAAVVAGAAAPARADDQAQEPLRTGKERLSDKPSNEQRVDDCKVPPARRTRPRPTTCSEPQR
jgi:hypothetical protein